MDILFIAHFVNAMLMIAMPVGLAIYLTRRFHLGWRLWWIGAATFVLSQVGHIPFNALASKLLNIPALVAMSPTAQMWFNAIFLGLSAGLFEELFRYGMFRWWAKDARSWHKAILAGAGHGGAEAIILGVITLYGFLQMVALRNADLSKVIPPSQLALATQQVHAFWTLDPWLALMGALERFFTIPIQISMAVIVAQTFIRKQWFWVWLAVFYHALVDGTSVVLMKVLPNINLIEIFVGIFAVLSIAIIFLLRTPELSETAPRPVPVPAQEISLKPMDETTENLDNTRYN